jgi:hypothetical protein
MKNNQHKIVFDGAIEVHPTMVIENGITNEVIPGAEIHFSTCTQTMTSVIVLDQSGAEHLRDLLNEKFPVKKPDPLHNPCDVVSEMGHDVKEKVLEHIDALAETTGALDIVHDLLESVYYGGMNDHVCDHSIRRRLTTVHGMVEMACGGLNPLRRWLSERPKAFAQATAARE